MRKTVLICALCCAVVAWAEQVTAGRWTLHVDETTGETDIIHAGKTLVSRNRACFRVGSTEYDQAQMTCRSITRKELSDDLGTGIELCVISDKNSVRAMEFYYIYANKPYIVTQLQLISGSPITSNYLAPVFSDTKASFLPSTGNYNLFVPWDNDDWVRFNNVAFGGELTSNEVTALYNASSGEALIVGSLEHTVWKSGIKAVTKSFGDITRLEAFGGLSNVWTRDMLPHGAVSGTSIISPKMMIGWFDDWRDGMEQYADLNAVISPKLPWDQGKPFIWNSWGALQKNINFTNATQNAEWIAGNLQGYNNGGFAYIDLDSYWSNLTTSRLKQFAQQCHERGQKAGIYWTPFLDWSNLPDKQVEGAMEYKYSDIWLRVNGQPMVRTEATACDPTHPATRARMKQYMNYFSSWGFDFVKLDYMVHGAMQADSYYDPAVTTAMQAYSSGMAYLDSVAGNLFINLSIAPLFPSQFSHGRRIACDSYGSLSESEYTLNSTTFGWWLDHAYSYNDADNIVLKGQAEGVNKIRILSSVLTGLLSIGDDFSDSGDEDVKERANKLLNNKGVLQCARHAHAFRPINPPAGTGAASDYYTSVEDTVYLATVNWEKHNTTFTFDYAAIGLNRTLDYTVEELWSGAVNTLKEGMQVTCPKANCLLFKIYPKHGASAENPMENTMQACKMLQNGQIIILRNEQTYTITGQRL